MLKPLTEKVTLGHLRSARQSGQKTAMLTCYDYTTARLMQEAGVPALLVGDSAANVILGHPTTLPVSLSFMIEITAAVRRGAPLAFLVADMPFGSYQASVAQGTRNICRMVKQSQCDCVKIEVTAHHLPLIRSLAAAGVPVMAHLGLRPQSVGILGGYKYQGRTADEAASIVALALQMEEAGAVALLIEAVPPEVANAVIQRTSLPVIGCGAGPGCHGCVIVTHDGLGLTPSRPKFVPNLAELGDPLREAFGKYVHAVSTGAYPSAEHQYTMAAAEQDRLKAWIEKTDKNSPC